MNHFQDRWIEALAHDRIAVIRREAENRRLVKLARGSRPARRLPEFRLSSARLNQFFLALRMAEPQEPALSPCPEPAVWD